MAATLVIWYTRSRLETDGGILPDGTPYDGVCHDRWDNCWTLRGALCVLQVRSRCKTIVKACRVSIASSIWVFKRLTSTLRSVWQVMHVYWTYLLIRILVKGFSKDASRDVYEGKSDTDEESDVDSDKNK